MYTAVSTISIALKMRQPSSPKKAQFGACEVDGVVAMSVGARNLEAR